MMETLIWHSNHGSDILLSKRECMIGRIRCQVTDFVVCERAGAKHGVSVTNVATRWVIEQPAVAGAIVGARLGLKVGIIRAIIAWRESDIYAPFFGPCRCFALSTRGGIRIILQKWVPLLKKP
jgi:hypothetical protein